jgi:hypothetical protein
MPLTNKTDDVEELGSSTSNEDPDAVIAASQDATITDAESSTATDENDASLLDVVRDVVSEREAPAAAASSADGTEAGALDADGKPIPAGPDNENYLDVPFNKHPRFQALIAQRNGLREDAGRYQNVVNYLSENNLTSDEAANALHTFALAKVDPAKAFAELKPWLQELLVAAGEVLPSDLQARVDAGEFNAATAMELSRERAKTASHEKRQGFEAQRQARTSQTNLVTELVSTADSWVADRRVKDPNFAAKEPRLQREIAFLQQQEGRPKDKAGVLAQLKKAYDAVNKDFTPPAAAAAPAARKPAIKPVVGGAVTGTVREKPKTMLEIVRAGRRQNTG